MLNQENTEKFLLQRLTDRIGNPLDWSYVDKTLLVLGVVLSANLSLSLFLYAQTHISSLTLAYVNPQAANIALRNQLAFILLYVVFGSIALRIRKRNPKIRWLAYATAISIATHNSWFICGFGHSTSPITFLLIFLQAFVGFLLFDLYFSLCAVAAFVLGVGFQIVMEQLRLIPYAHFLAGSPFTSGTIDRLWMAWALGAGAFTTAVMIVLGFYVIQRWREREAQLEVANRLIRRYVPSQLADRILAGQHHESIGYERRNLTIFFSDIKGFTETADQLEAEKLSELLNEYLSEMSEIANKYGGTVDKFVGDAIMIFFGAPMATNDRDHALRAVCMAMEMQERMHELNRKWYKSGIQTPFQIRVGINTGMANVGDFGSRDRMDYTAIGNQVNLAARIEARCDPGKIMISHSTWGLVHDEIACIQKGEIEVKGIHYPIKVYEIETASGEESGT